MLPASQISAHRAQPASRSKSRWQPYSTLPQTTTLIPPRSPSSNCMNILKPSLPTPLPPSFTPRSKNFIRLPSGSSQIPKDSIQRDFSKHKFALGLIDQAVKSLSDIWHSEDIPSVFRGPEPISLFANTPQSLSRSTSTAQQILVSTGAETDSALLPLRTFIHEVLKRSRTSGSILQTALCYLEAVRPKIPDIFRDEKMGIRSYFMPESAIQPATEAEMQVDNDPNLKECPQMVSSEDSLRTARALNVDQAAAVQEIDANASSVIAEPSLPVNSPLPSPLLCPRRTFLAALILASKFSQDKCYSNRAWAKLSGLPPREIGRCERALGQALDWRLWVGKKSPCSGSSDVVTSTTSGSVTTAPASASASRSVVRSQSESCVVTLPSTRVPFLCPSEPGPSRRLNDTDCNSSQNKGLRRCATAPSESFAPSDHLQSMPLSRPEVDLTLNGMSYGSVGRTRMYQSTSSYDVSDSGSSSSSSLITPSPSLSGDRTIQVSSFEEGTFPPSYNTSQPWLGISDPRYGPIRTSSPASFLVDPKAAAGAKTMQTEMSNTVMSEPDPFLGLRGVPFGFGGGSGPCLWHADAGRVLLELTRVH